MWSLPRGHKVVLRRAEAEEIEAMPWHGSEKGIGSSELLRCSLT